MGTNRFKMSKAVMLGATVMLTWSIAYAAPSTAATISTQGAAVVAVANNADKPADATRSVEPASFPSTEVGVRRAAAESPESLRRYIQRTRMVYNYYYWSFAKEQ